MSFLKIYKILLQILFFYDKYIKYQLFGQLTQLVECHFDVVKVRGSSPLLPTKHLKVFFCSLIINQDSNPRVRSATSLLSRLCSKKVAFSLTRSNSPFLTENRLRCFVPRTRLALFPYCPPNT